jgi:hypothetical protein
VLRVLALLVVVALAAGSGARADHLDPKRKLRPADQARARTMLLRLGDLPAGFALETTTGLDPHLTCKALDESDLTLTGEARSPSWSRQFAFVTSVAAVYRSGSDALASWRRGTSAAGRACLAAALAKSIGLGERLRASVRVVRFPRVAERTTALRLTLSGAPGATAPLAFVDWVLLGRGRANAGILLGSVVQPPDASLERSLARVVGARMARSVRSG